MPLTGDEPSEDQNIPTNGKFAALSPNRSFEHAANFAVAAPSDWTLFCQSLERLRQHIPPGAYADAYRTSKCHTVAILLGAITTIEGSSGPEFLSARLDAEIRAHRASLDLYYAQAERNGRLEQEHIINDRLLKSAHRDRDIKRTQIRDLNYQLQIANRDVNELQSQINDLSLMLKAKDSRIEIDRRYAQNLNASIKELINRLAERDSEIRAKDLVLHELQERNSTAVSVDQASEA